MAVKTKACIFRRRASSKEIEGWVLIRGFRLWLLNKTNQFVLAFALKRQDGRPTAMRVGDKMTP